jgi:hypothetical protein
VQAYREEEHPLGPMLRVHRVNRRGMVLEAIAFVGLVLAINLAIRLSGSDLQPISLRSVGIFAAVVCAVRMGTTRPIVLCERGVQVGEPRGRNIVFGNIRELHQRRHWIEVRLLSNERVRLFGVEDMDALARAIRERLPRALAR